MHPYTAALVRQKPQQRQIAGLVASTQSGKTMEGLGVGGVLGALAGAALGSASGRMEAVGIGAAAGAAVGGIVGYIAGKPASGPVAQQTPGSGALPENLAAGAMSPVALSLSGDNQIEFSAPGSGTITGVTSSLPSVVPTIVVPASATTATVTAAGQGTALLTINWNDGSNPQVSTVQVTVGA
jgi:hypothetical protein